MDLLQTIWAVVEPLIALCVFFFTARTFFLQKRYSRKFTLNNNVGDEAIIINLTSHPLAHFEAQWGLDLEQVHIPCTAPLGEGQVAVEQYLVALFTTKLPQAVYARLLAGDSQLIFALPNAAKYECIAVLHAIYGGFPKTTRSLRNKDGQFEWVKPRDLQLLRLATRHQVRGS